MNPLYAFQPTLAQPFSAWQVLYQIGLLGALCMMLGAVFPHLPRKPGLPTWLENTLGFMGAFGILMFIGWPYTVTVYLMVLATSMSDMHAPIGAIVLMLGFGAFGWLSIPMAMMGAFGEPSGRLPTS